MNTIPLIVIGFVSTPASMVIRLLTGLDRVPLCDDQGRARIPAAFACR